MSEDKGELAPSSAESQTRVTRWSKFREALKRLNPQTKEKSFELPPPDKGEEWKFGAAFSVLGRIGYKNMDDLKKVFSKGDTQREFRHQQVLFAPGEQTSLGNTGKSILLREVGTPNYDGYFTVSRDINLMDKSKTKYAAASVGVFAKKVSDPDSDLKIKLTLTNKSALEVRLLLSQKGVQIEGAKNTHPLMEPPYGVWMKGDLQDPDKMAFAQKELKEAWGINLDEVANKPVDVEQTVKSMIETPAANGPFSSDLIKFK